MHVLHRMKYGLAGWINDTSPARVEHMSCPRSHQISVSRADEGLWWMDGRLCSSKCAVMVVSKWYSLFEKKKILVEQRLLRFLGGLHSFDCSSVAAHADPKPIVSASRTHHIRVRRHGANTIN